MLLSEIQKQVVETASAVLVRPRRPIEKPYQYDIKPLFQGNNHGWIILDFTTANALSTVYKALSPENQIRWD